MYVVNVKCDGCGKLGITGKPNKLQALRAVQEFGWIRKWNKEWCWNCVVKMEKLAKRKN